MLIEESMSPMDRDTCRNYFLWDDFCRNQYEDDISWIHEADHYSEYAQSLVDPWRRAVVFVSGAAGSTLPGRASLSPQQSAILAVHFDQTIFEGHGAVWISLSIENLWRRYFLGDALRSEWMKQSVTKVEKALATVARKFC